MLITNIRHNVLLLVTIKEKRPSKRIDERFWKLNNQPNLAPCMVSRISYFIRFLFTFFQGF